MLKEVVMFLDSQDRDCMFEGFEAGLFQSITDECHSMTKEKQKESHLIVISKQDI